MNLSYLIVFLTSKCKVLMINFKPQVNVVSLKNFRALSKDMKFYSLTFKFIFLRNDPFNFPFFVEKLAA